jgi:glycosyltransferase involved in cell wall biosynthesis
VLCTNLASKDKKLFCETRRADFDGVEVIYFNTRKLFPLGRHSFGLFICPEMVKFCREQLVKFDVVHVDGYRDFPSVVACYFALKHAVPYVIQPRGGIPVAVSSIAAKHVFDRFLGRPMLRECALLIASSRQETLGFNGIVPARTRVVCIYNGIDFREFADLPQKDAFRSRFGISEQNLITYLGRLHAQKGIDVLIRAVAVARCRRQSRLAPDDGVRSKLVALVRELDLQNRVTFVGPLNGRERLGAYVDSDVVVYAGQSESFGLVPFEATVCGIPSISSEDSPSAEILGPLGVSFQVPYGEFQRLATTIDAILEARADVIPRVRAAAARLRGTLSWEEVARRYEDAYSAAVAANRPDRAARFRVYSQPSQTCASVKHGSKEIGQGLADAYSGLPSASRATSR